MGRGKGREGNGRGKGSSPFPTGHRPRSPPLASAGPRPLPWALSCGGAEPLAGPSRAGPGPAAMPPACRCGGRPEEETRGGQRRAGPGGAGAGRAGPGAGPAACPCRQPCREPRAPCWKVPRSPRAPPGSAAGLRGAAGPGHGAGERGAGRWVLPPRPGDAQSARGRAPAACCVGRYLQGVGAALCRCWFLGCVGASLRGCARRV